MQSQHCVFQEAFMKVNRYIEIICTFWTTKKLFLCQIQNVPFVKKKFILTKKLNKLHLAFFYNSKLFLEGIDPVPAVHSDIICDNCSNPIMGFRYKCVNCDDYDLCQKCEMQETHPDHFMLRMPKPLKFVSIKVLL